MNWRENPSRVAWILLIAAFLACCLLTIGVPLAGRAFVLHATRPKPVSVAATTGTAQLWLPGATDPTAVTERRSVAEESRIITDATARAVLTVAADNEGDRVMAAIQLLPDTALGITKARSPRFAISRDAHLIDLTLQRGRLFIATQRADERDVRLHLTSPHAAITFAVGTFDLMIEGDGTTVRIRSGTAQVLAEGRLVTAGSGERVSIAAGSPPELPVPDTVNLVLNGSFERSLEPLWQPFAVVEGGLEPSKVELVNDDRRKAVRFMRRAEDGKPNRAGVTQVVDRDVQGYDRLVLRLDLKLLHQSVPGGGYLGTEYPLMVDLFYTDIYGKDLHWFKGFYYLDLPPGSTYPAPVSGDSVLPDRPSAEKVTLGAWYTYESTNLFELLRDTRPARINSISIYANGHDYESLATDVLLTVQ